MSIETEVNYQWFRQLLIGYKDQLGCGQNIAESEEIGGLIERSIESIIVCGGNQW